MTPAPHDPWEVPDDAIVPAVWFCDLGIHVFPTVSKVPAVPKGTSQFDYRCTREQAAGFKEYGVPLGLFAVADSDSQKTDAWNAKHLPDTPFKVTTGPYHDGSPGRGRHRWYRLVADAPHFIHRGGHVIEFRHRGQYVVGPGSVRRDGVTYTADAWSWNVSDVPFFPANFLFDDRPLRERGSLNGEPFEFPDVVQAGERHDMLFRQIRSWRHIFDQAEAREGIHLINLAHCRPPLTEDEAFERWFMRAWNKPDRPFAEAGVLTIARQLDKAGQVPTWGPTKTKKRRTVVLGPETIVQLRTHRGSQRELKMRNRKTYSDFNLIFAKEPMNLQRPKAQLGQPLDTLSEGRFQALVKAAGVRKIKFHGVRHTVATLSLQAGTPPHVVAARLGHSVMELMKTYAHALPNMQQDAATRLGALLHG